MEKKQTGFRGWGVKQTMNKSNFKKKDTIEDNYEVTNHDTDKRDKNANVWGRPRND